MMEADGINKHQKLHRKLSVNVSCRAFKHEQTWLCKSSIISHFFTDTRHETSLSWQRRWENHRRITTLSTFLPLEGIQGSKARTLLTSNVVPLQTAEKQTCLWCTVMKISGQPSCVTAALSGSSLKMQMQLHKKETRQLGGDTEGGFDLF